MSDMKKTVVMCPYCDYSWSRAHIPNKWEFDCPSCGVPLSDEEVHYCGHKIDCAGGFFDRTKSKHHDRDELSPQAVRESAFYEEWKSEHSRSDLLNLLLKPVLRDSKDSKEVSDRERFIVNTIIQWLGTNVGFGFLEEALDRAGYKIVRKEDKTNET